MSKSKSNLFLFVVSVILILLLALFGPEEQSLGANVRIVYLHGAWVLTAEVVLLLAGLAGLIGLLTPRKTFHGWSAALGRTGIFFWVTYLPLSLWAMQSNWNGLFLAEPRFRLAMIFAVTGVLLQAGLWLINMDWITSLANVIFIVVLRLVFATASNVMHPPPSPIFNSGNYVIIGFFLAMIALSLVASYFLTRVFVQLQPKNN
ncbi:MAG: hypothetical protein ABI904_15825 [Chloroflexota bacterium]